MRASTNPSRIELSQSILDAPALSDVLASQLHQEQEAKNKTIAEEMLNDDKELSKAIERIDERNELIMDLIQVSRKPGSGLLDPKVGLCIHRLLADDRS